MNPGFRYHVTTIAAIFLALGVGIMIGSSFVQSQIVDRQTRRLEALGDQFNREIAPLREANGRYASFLELITPSITGARLAGIRIALVQTGDYPDTTRIVRESLERAGAQVESETVIAPDFNKKGADSLPEVIKHLASQPDQPAGEVGLITLLADGISRAGRGENIIALNKAGLLEMEGDYSRPVSFVVLIGGATVKEGARADFVDLPLAMALKPILNTVIAVEPLEAEISYVETLREASISTVDNANTDIGRIAVVLALQSPPGEYGVKQTARNGLLPAPAQR